MDKKQRKRKAIVAGEADGGQRRVKPRLEDGKDSDADMSSKRPDTTSASTPETWRGAHMPASTVEASSGANNKVEASSGADKPPNVQEQLLRTVARVLKTDPAGLAQRFTIPTCAVLPHSSKRPTTARQMARDLTGTDDRIVYPITADYVRTWTPRETIRETVQNLRDACIDTIRRLHGSSHAMKIEVWHTPRHLV